LVGYASAMRRSALVALTLADVEHKPAGLLLSVRRSKTDQPGHGQVVAVAHGRYAVTDPVAVLAAWRTVRGETSGPLFTRTTARSVSLDPMSGTAVARMLRTRAEAAGLDGTRITAHSLRAGHATTAALAGVPLHRIAAQTRHQDISVLVNRYIRPLEALARALQHSTTPHCARRPPARQPTATNLMAGYN
jgi:integrase